MIYGTLNQSGIINIDFPAGPILVVLGLLPLLVYAALILYYTLQSDKVSAANKAMIIGALGYLISPLDVVPDAIPIAGLADDLGVLIFVLKKVWTDIDPSIQERSKEKLSKWFDEDEIAEIDDIFKGE